MNVERVGLPRCGQRPAVDRDVGRCGTRGVAQIAVAADLQRATIDEGATCVSVAARQHPSACVLFGDVSSGRANGTGKAAPGGTAQRQAAISPGGGAGVGQRNSARIRHNFAAATQDHQPRVGGCPGAVHEGTAVVHPGAIQGQVARAGHRLAIEVQRCASIDSDIPCAKCVGPASL